MFHKLHRRDAAGTSPVRGLSCDEAGVFFGGGCALVEPRTENGRVIYRVRAAEEINKALAAGFGAQVDIARYLPSLRRVAELMTDGWWGLAQITALQMCLPDLADDAAVERLLKAEALMRFNLNHKPAGPGGGQFTTADDGGGGGDQSVTSDRHDGAANAAPIPRLSYRTTSGGPNTPFWGTGFELSSPSAKGGYIIQKIEVRYEIDPPGSKMVYLGRPYWEAFPVNPGSTHSTFFKRPNATGSMPVGGGDDVWAGQIGLENSHGVQVDIGTARFYEALTTADLARRGFAVGNVKYQGDNLMNTYDDPKFSLTNASNSVARISRNRF